MRAPAAATGCVYCGGDCGGRAIRVCLQCAYDRRLWDPEQAAVEPDAFAKLVTTLAVVFEGLANPLTANRFLRVFSPLNPGGTYIVDKLRKREVDADLLAVLGGFAPTPAEVEWREEQKRLDALAMRGDR